MDNAPAAAERRLASITETARYAAVSTWTVQKWIDDGLLPAYKLGPRLVRVDLNDLDAMLTPRRTA